MLSPGYGGWLWVLNAVFVLVLAAAIIYGGVHWRARRRNRALQRERDEATRRLYKEQP